ncbi:MAG: LytTR family DNA-binding domain-containing protein [Pseudomonadota bacterium]
MSEGRHHIFNQAASVWRDGTLFFGYDINSWRRFAAVGVVFSFAGALVITAFDPSSTTHLPIWKAVILWSLQLAVAVILMTLVVIASVLMGVPSRWASVPAAIALPFLLTPISLIVDRSIGGEDGPDPALVGYFSQYTEELINITPASLAFAALLFTFVSRAGRLSQALRVQLSQMKKTEPSLRDALPEVPLRIGNDLIRLEAQDHYVLVVTTEGTATLSQSLAECIDRVKGFAGTQSHRSHWVRYRHVQRLAKSGSAYRAILSNNETVPVSRRRYRHVRKHL